jgi:hypothetical protein
MLEHEPAQIRKRTRAVSLGKSHSVAYQCPINLRFSLHHRLITRQARV